MTRAIRYGDQDVPVVDRTAWVVAPHQPYRKTYRLRPGQHWRDAELTPAQWENYVVLDDGDVVPVGAVIARELVNDGALEAVFTEMWGGLVLVDHDLLCVEERGSIRDILDAIRTATRGRLVGLPDVLAVFPNERIVMREAKNRTARDKLGPKQHAFARVAQKLFGDRLDLAIVEWGAPPPPRKRGMRSQVA